MSSEPPIVVHNLNHSYGKGALRKQILFDVSTEIPRGEIVIVTGPSGSGKTTMLTLVGALRSAQEGSVRILGQELCGASDATLEQARRRSTEDHRCSVYRTTPISPPPRSPGIPGRSDAEGPQGHSSGSRRDSTPKPKAIASKPAAL